MLAPSLSYINDSGKHVTSVAVPSQEVLVDFFKGGGITIDRQATLEANTIARIINDPANFSETTSDHTEGDLPVEIIGFNADGGQWETTMPLAALVIPGAAFLWLLGRMKSGVTQERVEAELTPLLNDSSIAPAGALAPEGALASNVRTLAAL